jgi:divalent metal cation (Fe/Co/Zn/Cd) transporter
VLFESVKKLVSADIPNTSVPGMLIAGASIIVMPLLTWQKYKIGKQIDSKSLIADSKETLACAFLSVSLLVGLGVNYLFGFWQVDSIVGLIIVVFLFREGREDLRESGEED